MNRTHVTTTLNRAFPTLLILIALTHLAFVLIFSVTIPFWDEWALYTSGGGLNLADHWDWYFSTHNEHRIVPTRIITALNHWLTGRQAWAEHLVNFVFYSGYAAILWQVAKRQALAAPWIVALCLIPWFSPFSFYDVFHTYHSGWHISICLAALSAMILFIPPNEKKPTNEKRAWVLGTFTALVCMVSFGHGAVCALVIMLVKTLEIIVHRHRSRQRQILPMSWVACLGLFAVGLFFHLRSFPIKSATGTMSFPWQTIFWDFLVQFLATGFGFEDETTVMAWICTAIILSGISMIIVLQILPLKPTKLQNTSRSDLWFWTALLLAILASACVITYARGHSGGSGAKTYRFYEPSMYFVPPILLSWFLISKLVNKKIFAWLARGILLFTFISLHDSWDFYRYQMRARTMKDGQACLKQAIRAQAAEYHCPELAPHNLKEHVEHAKTLDAYFMRNLMRDY